MYVTRLPVLCALLVAAILGGCVVEPGARSTQRSLWESQLYQGHPLVGLIWKPAANRYATAGEVYGAMRKADFVLIGEKHDNPDHHWIQAKLIGELAAQRRKAAVLFEMITESQQAALDAYLAAHPDDAAGIGEAIGWEESGWPDWKIYQPIAEFALYSKMPLLAGGLDRTMTKRIAREGYGALGKERAVTLKLAEPLDQDLRAEMRQVIFESHCEQLPEPMLDPMLSVTLAKDAIMADHMIQAGTRPAIDVPVLIAGDGHARADWGVPMHLARRAPGARIVTVGIIEVEMGVIDPIEYGDRYGGDLAFDFVWFTPRVDDKDPCEVFAEQLRQMREKRLKSGGEPGS